MHIFHIDTELTFLGSIQKNGLGIYEYMIVLETFYSYNAAVLKGVVYSCQVLYWISCRVLLNGMNFLSPMNGFYDYYKLHLSRKFH